MNDITSKANLKTCKKGHQYYKSSDCPTCPVCENERKPDNGFLAVVAAPARRALERAGILSLEELSKRSETEILQLHGMGPGSIPKLYQALKSKGLTFRKD
jgi:predicted RecB family nuclease